MPKFIAFILYLYCAVQILLAHLNKGTQINVRLDIYTLIFGVTAFAFFIQYCIDMEARNTSKTQNNGIE